MKTCSDCNSEYEEEGLVIPNPIPDKMCAVCGTVLTDEKIIELKKNNDISSNSAINV
jgi:hypothetical protein